MKYSPYAAFNEEAGVRFHVICDYHIICDYGSLWFDFSL